jgi:cbb3-type cytochrome oxidase cytochrome c subunit
LLRFAKEKMGLELTWIALAASLLMAFGTKRTGPDLSHVGGKYDTQWHRTHFRNPRDLVPGSIMPPFPWIANNEEEFQALVAYLQRLGRAKNWRPDNDYEK